MNLLRKNSIFLFFLILSLNCTITLKPRVNVSLIDATDALEKQILGEFKIIESNYLYIKDVSVKVEKNFKKEDTIFYKAMKERIYFEDIINKYKKEHYIGEAENGRLEVLKKDALNSDSELLDNVNKTVGIDNNAREIIVKYIAKKNNELDKINFYWNTFYKIQVKKSESGTFFESNGIWKQKK